MLFVFSSAALLWFLGFVRARLLRAEPAPGTVSGIAFAAGALAVGLNILGQAAQITLTLPVTGPDSPGRRCRRRGSVPRHPEPGQPAGRVMFLAIALLSLRLLAYPRWLGWIAAAAAAASFVSTLLAGSGGRPAVPDRRRDHGAAAGAAALVRPGRRRYAAAARRPIAANGLEACRFRLEFRFPRAVLHGAPAAARGCARTRSARRSARRSGSERSSRAPARDGRPHRSPGGPARWRSHGPDLSSPNSSTDGTPRASCRKSSWLPRRAGGTVRIRSGLPQASAAITSPRWEARPTSITPSAACRSRSSCPTLTSPSWAMSVARASPTWVLCSQMRPLDAGPSAG